MKWLQVLVPVILLLVLTPAYPTLYSQASQALAIWTGTSPFPTLPFTTTGHPNGLARIMGSVVIGPTCPVENAERPCPAPDYSGLVLVLTPVNQEHLFRSGSHVTASSPLLFPRAPIRSRL